MTKHEPECWIVSHANPLNGCICTELRACEQRVLSAAREAVKVLRHRYRLIWPTDEGAIQALNAAIDALKEKP